MGLNLKYSTGQTPIDANESDGLKIKTITTQSEHRLVSIHCFPNGNGRHSRVMADLIVEKLFNAPSFSWGQSHSLHASNEDVRSAYLTALKEADRNNYTPLIEFARN